MRASTGSFFAVPAVRVPSHREVMHWVDEQRRSGVDLAVLGTDEQGDVDTRNADLRQPVELVVGNETVGPTAAWRERCDSLSGIPTFGIASSLNAATAGTIALYGSNAAAGRRRSTRRQNRLTTPG